MLPSRDAEDNGAPPFSFNPDHPAGHPSEDRLDVYPFVRRLAEPLLRAPKESSLVVALYGPWGYGKSTALNFLHQALADVAGGQTTAANKDIPQPVIVRFTPWLYTGVETLLASFFETLGTVIGDQPGDDGERKRLVGLLKGMGEFIGPAAKTVALFLPVPGAAAAAKFVALMPELLAGAAKGTATKLEGGEVTFQKRKNEAAHVLGGLADQGRSQRVVVLIDDLDRAGPDEVLAMLKLVKLVADLPNVSYVVAMDRDRVHATLDRSLGEGVGESFLEKIVQVGVHLPPFGADRLSRFVVEDATAVAQRAGLDVAPLEVDWRAWELVRMDTYEGHLRRALRTPRDVVRLLNAYGFAALTGNARADLHPVDLLLLCLLQTRFPSVYAAVRGNRRFLLGQEHDSGFALGRNDAEQRQRAHAERRRRLAEIVAVPGDDAAGVQSAAAALDEAPAVWILGRGRRPVALDIVLALFPHCLGGHQGNRDAPRERREARICAPERFDGYFRLDPAPGELQLAELKAVFETLSSPDFSDADAQALVDSVADLSDAGRESLRQGLTDQASATAMSYDEARALATALPRLARAGAPGRRFPADVVGLLGILAAKRLRGIYVYEDQARDPATAAEDAAAAATTLVAVVRALPADDGAELADDLVPDGERNVQLSVDERRTVAAAGLDRALEALGADSTRLADAPPREFSRAIWRCYRLAVAAGQVEEGARYGPLTDYVNAVLTDSPDRLSEVIALVAGWTGRDLFLPSLESRSTRSEAHASISSIVDVERVEQMARDAVARGAVSQARYPNLVRDFLKLSDQVRAAEASDRAGDGAENESEASPD